MMVLETTDLHFAYPHSDFALQIEHFQVASGEAVAIVGPSGCGKTTFLELAAGIKRPDRGSVSIDGAHLSDMPPGKRAAFRLQRIGLVFQEFELIEHLSVRENIALPLHLGLREPKLRARAETLAKLTGIESQLEKGPRRLSQGERQRVAICRALAPRPHLILADEPTGNLDPDNKRSSLQLLLRQARENGCAVIVATHDRDVLDGFDRVEDFGTRNRNAGT